jgi:polysaccharide deacetylase 2 family uncharacterized protein YibQ
MWTIRGPPPAAADDADRRSVRRELAALGKTYAYAATIDEIADWAKTLEKKGVAHAPASALLRTAAPTR